MSNLKDFIRLKQVGKGAFGTAWLVESKINLKKYVIKELGQKEMSEREKIDARKEVMLLAKMNHTNIVTYFNSFEEGGRVHILMEFCENGDLGARIKAQNGIPFKEDQILDYFVQLCHGIKHIHDNKILHRDIKPQNIFLTMNNIVKLGDFGIAKLMNSTTAFTSTTVGTPFYFSPELCSRRMYNNKSDIWSLGCVLYELSTLNHAFSAQEMAILALRIKNVSYKPISTNYSSGLRMLISSIFQRDPRERPNINEILKKPFISRIFEKNCPEIVPRPVQVKEVTPRRASPAINNRVNSALNNRKVINKENLIANSPYLPSAKKPMLKKPENNKVSALVIKKNDLAKKGRAAMIINDRENGWKNVLSSPSVSKDAKEQEVVNSECNEKPKVKTPGMYDNYYADLDRIKQQQELREAEAKQHQHRFQRIQDDDISEGVYRKIIPMKNNMQCGGNAADRDRVVMEYLDNKQMAMFNRNRYGAGVALALCPGRKIEPKVVAAPPQPPLHYEDEMSERLNKIRQQNAEERRIQNIGDLALNFDKDRGQILNRENARLALEDLQKKIKQRSDELHQRLALKRLEREKDQETEQQKREVPIVKPSFEAPIRPNNVVLFPKRADPFVPIVRANVEVCKVPDHGMTNVLDQLKNMKPSGDEVKVVIKDGVDMKLPSLSVVLGKLREEPLTPRPTTAPQPEKTEIKKIKTDILKRLNKNQTILDKVEENEHRNSWCSNFDDNLIMKDDRANNLDDTIVDTSTMADVSVLSDGDEPSPRPRWSMDVMDSVNMARQPDDSKSSWTPREESSISLMTETVGEETIKCDDVDPSGHDTVTVTSTLVPVDVPTPVTTDDISDQEVEVHILDDPSVMSEVHIDDSTVTSGHDVNMDAWQTTKHDQISSERDERSHSSTSSDDDRIEVSMHMRKILEIKLDSSSSSEHGAGEDDNISKDESEESIRELTQVRSMPDLVEIDKLFFKKAKSESDLINSFNDEYSSTNDSDGNGCKDEDFSDEKADDENIFLKIEMIRAKLEADIGLDPLLDAMEFVRESQDLDGDHITDKLRLMLSNNEDAVNDIFHLVVLEEQYNNMD